MSKHENKYCPRCNRSFECKAGNISICQCNEINLSQATRVLVEEKYNDCLCLQCLKELEKLAQYAENS